MDAKMLVDRLKAKGVELYGIGDRLKCKDPRRVITSDELAMLKRHKADVLKAVGNHAPIKVPGGGTINQLIHGDSYRFVELIPTDSVDLIVTDPPYGIDFMGKDWDKAIPSVYFWKECLRVLKPGAFAFIMSSPRQDVLSRMMINLEQAGFNTAFTSIYWTYASGFPKAHNISKAIDKREGHEGEIVAYKKGVGGENINDVVNGREVRDTTEPGAKGIGAYGSGVKQKSVDVPIREHCAKAKPFEGSYGGFQPKPAVEVIIVVQKPPTEPTQVDQALKNGKGITWLDDCRIPYASENRPSAGDRTCNFGEQQTVSGGKYGLGWEASNTGRFPANLLVSDDVLDDGKKPCQGQSPITKTIGYGEFGGGTSEYYGAGEKFRAVGAFSRFFSLDAWAERNLPFLIASKASKREKNIGCDTLEAKPSAASEFRPSYTEKALNGEGGNPYGRWKKIKNIHPTVKPIKLMAYLITLGSREDDIVLDPFCGSGTTCMAATMLRRRVVGIDINPEYVEIASKRLSAVEDELHPNAKKEQTDDVERDKSGTTGVSPPK